MRGCCGVSSSGAITTWVTACPSVRDILKGALALRNRAEADDVSVHGLGSLAGKLRARMDRLLSWRPSDEDNRKLLAHLETEQEALFTFLEDIQVPATNYWSEQAIRPAVVNRKVFGGNRTWAGAHTQEVLSSFFQTSRQRGHDPTNLLVECLQDPQPHVVERLVPSWIQDPKPIRPPRRRATGARIPIAHDDNLT